MSMWLSKKKKGDLVNLCNMLNLRTDGLKKPDLENLLQIYLFEHQAELADDPTFASYYETLAARSPQKLRASPKLVNPIDPIIPEGTTRSRRRTSRYASAYTASESVEPEQHTTALAKDSGFSNGIPEVSSSLESEGASARGSLPPEPKIRTGSTTPKPESTAFSIVTPRVSRRTVGGKVTTTTVTDDMAATTTTALMPLSETRNIPLPPSPSAVATLIEENTNALINRYNTTLSRITPHVKNRITAARQHLSNVVTVGTLVHIHELFSLYRVLIPASSVRLPPLDFVIPFLSTQRFYLTNGPTKLTLPDLFRVLEWEKFWAPILVWAVLCMLLPGMVGYFVNMTRRHGRHGYLIDPLVYGLAKGLIGWTVWYKRVAGQGENLGIVEGAVGREVLVWVGSGVVALVGLWEAVLGGGSR